MPHARVKGAEGSRSEQQVGCLFLRKNKKDAMLEAAELPRS
jgi:hypothetical protein